MATKFGWATFGWAMMSLTIIVSHWTSWSSFSYNQASLCGLTFEFMTSKAHQAPIALSEPMISIVQQGSSLGSSMAFPSLNPLNKPAFGSLTLCQVLFVTKRMIYCGIQNRRERVSHVKQRNIPEVRVRFVERRDVLMQILASLDRDKNSSVSVALVFFVLRREECEKWLTVGLCVVTKITSRAYEWGETYGRTCFIYLFILMINWTCQWKRQTDSTGVSKISACDKKEARLKNCLLQGAVINSGRRAQCPKKRYLFLSPSNMGSLSSPPNQAAKSGVCV